MNASSVLIVGCGQLGNAMTPSLSAQAGWRVFGMRRHVENLHAGIEPIKGDYRDAQALGLALQGSEPDYIVLSLTPAARNAEGYEQGYLQAVKDLLSRLENRSCHILFVSSTSVYSQNDGQWIDENSVTEPEGYSGRTMLECESLLRNSGLAYTALRCGGIYGAGSGRLLRQIKNGQFSGSEHYTNRIHFQDCASAIVHLLEKHRCGEVLERAYLGVDSMPCKKSELERWLAEQLNIAYDPDEAFQKGAGVEVEGESELNKRQPSSKRCSNGRLLNSGFKFKYPSYKQGYAAAIQQST